MRHIVNESGRTMLEMLGVLAIMGVIMYGAIAGIGFGVESYKINATYNMIEDLSQGIIDLYSWSRSYPANMAPVVCQNDVVECDAENRIKSQWGDVNVTVSPTNGGANFTIKLVPLNALACSRLRDMTYSQVNVVKEESPVVDGEAIGVTSCDAAADRGTLVLISR